MSAIPVVAKDQLTIIGPELSLRSLGGFRSRCRGIANVPVVLEKAHSRVVAQLNAGSACGERD